MGKPRAIGVMQKCPRGPGSARQLLVLLYLHDNLVCLSSALRAASRVVTQWPCGAGNFFQELHLDIAGPPCPCSRWGRVNDNYRHAYICTHSCIYTRDKDKTIILFLAKRPCGVQAPGSDSTISVLPITRPLTSILVQHSVYIYIVLFTQYSTQLCGQKRIEPTRSDGVCSQGGFGWGLNRGVAKTLIL